MTTFYLPMAVIYTLIGGPAGFITAWIAVLLLCNTLSNTLVTYMLMPEIEKTAFDIILSREQNDDLVLLDKLRKVVQVPFIVKVTSFIWSIPRGLILPYLIVKLICTALLGSIPYIGTFLVAYIKAPTKGLQAHARYFTLKGYDHEMIKTIYKQRKGEYLGFGLVANLLETIPILSLLFMFTNTIGAALWAVAIESKKKNHEIVLESKGLINIEQNDPSIQIDTVNTSKPGSNTTFIT